MGTLTKISAKGLLWLLVLTLVIGCGGQVVESEQFEEVAEGDSGSSTIPKSTCTACDGQVECGFCLIQIFGTTHICPPNHPLPSPTCMDLGEQHISPDGVPFTCYYCN